MNTNVSVPRIPSGGSLMPQLFNAVANRLPGRRTASIAKQPAADGASFDSIQHDSTFDNEGLLMFGGPGDHTETEGDTYVGFAEESFDETCNLTDFISELEQDILPAELQSKLTEDAEKMSPVPALTADSVCDAEAFGNSSAEPEDTSISIYFPKEDQQAKAQVDDKPRLGVDTLKASRVMPLLQTVIRFSAEVAESIYEQVRQRATTVAYYQERGFLPNKQNTLDFDAKKSTKVDIAETFVFSTTGFEFEFIPEQGIVVAAQLPLSGNTMVVTFNAGVFFNAVFVSLPEDGYSRERLQYDFESKCLQFNGLPHQGELQRLAVPIQSPTQIQHKRSGKETWCEHDKPRAITSKAPRWTSTMKEVATKPLYNCPPTNPRPVTQQSTARSSPVLNHRPTYNHNTESPAQPYIQRAANTGRDRARLSNLTKPTAASLNRAQHLSSNSNRHSQLNKPRDTPSTVKKHGGAGYGKQEAPGVAPTYKRATAAPLKRTPRHLSPKSNLQPQPAKPQCTPTKGSNISKR